MAMVATPRSLKPEYEAVMREFMAISGGLHFIDEQQLLELCHRLSINYSTKKFRRLMRRLDPTQSNFVDFESVLQWLAKRDRKKRLNRIDAALGQLLVAQGRISSANSEDDLVLTVDKIVFLSSSLCNVLGAQIPESQIASRVRRSRVIRGVLSTREFRAWYAQEFNEVGWRYVYNEELGEASE